MGAGPAGTVDARRPPVPFEPNAREFAALIRRTGVTLSIRERRHAYQAGVYLFKFISTVGAPAEPELAPASRFDAGEAW